MREKLKGWSSCYIMILSHCSHMLEVHKTSLKFVSFALLYISENSSTQKEDHFRLLHGVI